MKKRMTPLFVLLTAGAACGPEAVAPRTAVSPDGLAAAKGVAATSAFRSYYVSPTGTAAGDGSSARPWSLAAALAQPRVVQPGDTIWLRGGRYQGTFDSQLTGTADRPVVLRQAIGERAIVDGRFAVEGSNAYYWGFEVTDSDTRRVSSQEGSDPTDLPRERVTVYVTGSYNKIINLVIHDLGDGLFSSAAAQGVEIYGNLVYNNGWIAPNQGNGHNMYLQNTGATKSVLDNVLFNSFAYGIQFYGSEAASLYNFRVEGNSIFNSGVGASPAFGPQADIMMRGADGRFGRTAFVNNNLFHEGGPVQSVLVGDAGGVPGDSIQFTGNTVQGEVSFNEMRKYVVTGNRVTSGSARLTDQSVLLSYRPLNVNASAAQIRSDMQANQWDGNLYASPAGNTQDPFFVSFNADSPTLRFDAWQRTTGFDATGRYVTGRLPADAARDVVVRPNKYEPGRAFITVWNPGKAGSAQVDVSGVLRSGDRYQVHHVYDVFGTPVLTGTYQGGKITLPLVRRTAPAPIGLSAPAQSSNEFNVFLLRKL